MVFSDSSARPACVAAALSLLGVLLVGCDKKPVEPATAPKSNAEVRPMRVAIVGDEPFAVVLARQWKARIERPLEVQQLTVEQLDSSKRLAADIVVYPSACLGTLVERKLIDSMPQEILDDPKYALRDVLQIQRGAEVRWGDVTYAVSFGSPQLVLMFRADLFERLQLNPPTTWDEYQQLASRLSRDELGDAAPPADQPWSATLEPLAEHWAAKVLLARAAAYASHPSQYSVLFDYTTMDPLITDPPFVRALKELVAGAKLGPREPDKFDPESARRALLAGQAGMVMSWPTRVNRDGSPFDIAAEVSVGFAELPGAVQAYIFGEHVWTRHEGNQPARVPLLAVAGRLGSVTRNARHPRQAAEVLALLSGRAWSARLSPHSAATTPFRKSQINKLAAWMDVGLPPEAVKQYGEVLGQSQTRPAHVASLRIPGWRRYLAALDTAVHAARTGSKSAEEALGETATAWQAITKEIGVEAQRVAYTRSLRIKP